MNTNDMLKRSVVAIIATLIIITQVSCSALNINDSNAYVTNESGDEQLLQFTPAPTANEADIINKHEFYEMNFDSAYCNSGIQQIFETETTVYFTCEKYDEAKHTNYAIVYFSDKEHKDWMPLCSRPDCMHNNKDCSAVLEGCASLKMWPYGDHIYYMLNASENEARVPVLWRMKLDGSDHEKLFEMEFPEGIAPYAVTWYWFFQHNYVLISLYVNEYDDPETYYRFKYVIDLSAKELEQKPFDLRDEKGEISDMPIPVYGNGELLYCVDDDGREVLLMDIAAQTLTKLCDLPFTGCYMCGYEDGLLYFFDDDSGKIAAVDDATGELSIVFEDEPMTRRWKFESGGYVFGAYPKSDERRGTEISDLTGKLIREIPYETYNRDIDIVRIMDGYVFGIDRRNGRSIIEYTPDWYLDLRDIGTDALQWRRWAP